MDCDTMLPGKESAGVAAPPSPPGTPASQAVLLPTAALVDTVGMRYIMGRVRAMHRHTPAEIHAIALELLSVRMCFHMSRHDWLQHVPPMFVGFHGFATDFERSVFLRVLKFATKPRVLNSTFQQNGAFEGFAILHPTTRAADVAMLESLCELFKMSAGVTDLGLYMSVPWSRASSASKTACAPTATSARCARATCAPRMWKPR